MKNEGLDLSVEPLDDDLLRQVNGGASDGNVDPQLKFSEFFAAWDSLGFPAHGWGVRQKEGMCDQWSEEQFPCTADEWLRRYKTW